MHFVSFDRCVVENRIRFSVTGLLAAVCLLTAPIAASAEEKPSPKLAVADGAERLGISAVQPESGRFVKIDGGYMVPYTTKLPGTDVSFTMVPIPGGKFHMGSPEGEAKRSKNEGPQFEVEVAPFWMGQYEITWAEYKEFMNLYSVLKQFELRGQRPVTDENRSDAITAPTELYDPSFTFEKGEDPQQPAVTMTPYAAKQYTKWLTLASGNQYRLPCEAEWEYACRAGTTTAFHFGDDSKQLGEYAWYYENSDETTHPVGMKKPNPWGLYDMHGNAAELTLDQVRKDGYKRHGGKTLTAVDSIDWPEQESSRAARGGSWDDDADRCRSAARLASSDRAWKSKDPNVPLSPWWYTSDPARGVGFRLVRPLQELPRDAIAKYWDADADSIRDAIENRLLEGRGVIGVVDLSLPDATKALEDDAR